MFYIERDASGRIIQIEEVPFTTMTEQRDDRTPEIDEWLLQRDRREASLSQLRQSDLEMVRVLEDLIEVLMSKGIISITDLPLMAQSKLTSRAEARRSLSGLEGLIAEDDEGLI
ncbi:tryptophan synthase subunit beta [Yokenella regensburgei]|uniref:tryptophan synthase subunit beta n=1 Tax=Yokenella regensburgei TaxID=158877 RepID=UPI003F153D58